MRVLETMVRGQVTVSDVMRKVSDRMRTTDDRGASALEYALLVGGIVVAVIAAVTAFGGTIGDLFTSASNKAKG